MTESAAERLTARLREDLKAAMRARSGDEVRLLRALLGAIDNAQAVPLTPDHKPADRHAFGDGSAEVARRSLGAVEITALLTREATERCDAARALEDHGQTDRAAALHAEAAMIARYLGN